MKNWTMFIPLTCLILCTFTRAHALQDSTYVHAGTIFHFDPDSAGGVRSLPYFDLHYALGFELGSRIGARVQFHEHYSGEIFYGLPPAGVILVQHVRAGIGLNWHSVKWPNLVFSFIDVTNRNDLFQYNLLFVSGGYMSMKDTGINGFVRVGFGYEFFRDAQANFQHAFKSFIVDAGLGVAF